jgi:predicted dehydrogenase
MDTISLREEERRPIVIIGAGGIVKDAHLPAYRQANLRVAAIYDTRHEKAVALAVEFDIPVAASGFQELLNIAENENAVFDMAVPAGQIMSVLPRLPDGSAVLIQKPMGNNLEEAQAILDICRQKRLVAGINFQLRHAPYIREARRLIEQ